MGLASEYLHVTPTNVHSQGNKQGSQCWKVLPSSLLKFKCVWLYLIQCEDLFSAQEGILEQMHLVIYFLASFRCGF